MTEFPSDVVCPKCKKGKLSQITEDDDQLNIVIAENCDSCDFVHELAKPL